MSDYYSSLGNDLAPMLGMPPLDQGEQFGPPMPTASQGGGASGAGAVIPGGGRGDSPPMPPPMNPTSGLDPFAKAQMDTAALMNGPNPTATQPGMPGPGVGPNNMPRPPMPPPQVVGGGPPGGPQGAGGPPMPPPIPGQGPPTGNSVPFGPSTDYATSLGIAPTDANRMTSALGGLGKGLSAAAGNSNKAGAVFSRGAGGAITGQIQEAQEQQKLAQGMQNQYMNQVSTAFKDLMSQKSVDSLEIYRKALAGKADALAAVAETGNPSAKAFLNTPEGRMNTAQAEANREYASNRLDIVQQLKDQLITPEDAKTKWAELQANKDKRLQDAYTRHGVDPSAVPDMMSRGQALPRKFSDVKTGQWYAGADGAPKQKTANSSDYKPDDKVQWINPWDASKMSKEQAHMTIADGQYYTDGKGGMFTKNPAPPPPAPAAPPVRQMAPPNPMADPQAAYGQADPMSVYSGAFAGAPQ